jgi:hypothetical protein
MLRAVADDGEVLGDCADSLSVKEDMGARAVADADVSRRAEDGPRKPESAAPGCRLRARAVAPAGGSRGVRSRA